MTYKISGDDPDIILMKEMFGDDLDVFHPQYQRTHVPGTEPLQWNQLDVYSGPLLIRYLNHCTDHCKYLLKWQGNNFAEVIQLIPKLKDKAQEDKQLEQALNLALNTTSDFETDANHDLATILEISPLELAIVSSCTAWTALADYCVDNEVFAAVTKKITSDTKVRKHHFLAVVAIHLVHYVREHVRLDDLQSPSQFLPLIYSLIQDAEQAQELERESSKKRQIQSPDQFLMHELGKRDNDEPYLTPEIIRQVFLKGWLYHYTSGNKEYTHKHLVYTIQEKLKLYKSDKTIGRWLTQVNKPGALLADYRDSPAPELEEAS